MKVCLHTPFEDQVERSSIRKIWTIYQTAWGVRLVWVQVIETCMSRIMPRVSKCRVLESKKVLLVFSFSSPYICPLGLFRHLSEIFLFLLDPHHYLGNSIFIFRFHEISPYPASKINRHNIAGLDFEWNRKWYLAVFWASSDRLPTWTFLRFLWKCAPWYDVDSTRKFKLLV